MSNKFKICKTASAFILSFGCALASDPSSFTTSLNQAVNKQLPFQNREDFINADKGFIAPLLNDGIIKLDNGKVVWDLPQYAFLNDKTPSPSSVNPSLWRQGQLLAKAGLYKVNDGIYQVRGQDLSNMTIIEGKEGIILIDPLVSTQTAAAALELYFQNREKKPVKAVIYSHSHVDHFGGVKGVVNEQDVKDGKVQILAPKGFTEAAIDENIMAGNAMARRASYMYGNLLPRGPTGQVTSGLGLTSSSGTVSLILPTDTIEKTGEEREIDGIKFVFLFAPDSEAPAEMLFFLPQFKALGVAEDASHTMHNLYSLRGAKIRDAKAWATYLNQALAMFGSQTAVVFGQHHWPTWGNAESIDYLEKQRDLYKYMHDQTLRLANHGYTMTEIAEMIQLPDSLSKEWYNRGYYGSLNHNVKSIYNFYLGWFDGNPSTLNPLPPIEASKKYIAYMGGSDAVMEKAFQDYNKGEYRWTAEVLNHLVYADPSNKKAKDLLANTLEQLGYITENATWRNFYLTGASELREGIKQLPSPDTNNSDMNRAMPINMFLDYLAVRLNGPKAVDNPLELNVLLTDTNESFVLGVKNGVLNHFINRQSDKALATLKTTRDNFIALMNGKSSAEKLESENLLVIQGNKSTLKTFLSLLDSFNFWFNVIEPQTQSDTTSLSNFKQDIRMDKIKNNN